jgi:hypothetical protein
MLGRRVIPGQAGRPPPKDTERASAGSNRLKDRQTRDGGCRRKDIDVVEASLRTHPAHHGAKSRNRGPLFLPMRPLVQQHPFPTKRRPALQWTHWGVPLPKCRPWPLSPKRRRGRGRALRRPARSGMRGPSVELASDAPAVAPAGSVGQTKGPVRCRRGLVKRSRRRIPSARLLPRPSQGGRRVYG